MQSREALQEKVNEYNQAIDTIFSEDASDEEKQAARTVTDTLITQDLGGGVTCGCGHPVHLRINCLDHRQS